MMRGNKDVQLAALETMSLWAQKYGDISAHAEIAEYLFTLLAGSRAAGLDEPERAVDELLAKVKKRILLDIENHRLDIRPRKGPLTRPYRAPTVRE